MITRRNVLKGAAAGVIASAAAATYIRTKTEKQGLVFGLAPVKREGGTYYVDPMDDPDYRGPMGQGGKYGR